MDKQYMVITPARDEERFLPFLIESMARQTVKPRRWIIIDDGIRDATAALTDAAAKEHRWIRVHHLERNRVRKRGGASIIMQHLPREAWADVDFILRLDADISFGRLFVESLMAEFEAARPHVGPGGSNFARASRPGAGLRPRSRLSYPGSNQDVRARLLRSDRRAEAGPGWDTIDETRAMMRGFKTRSFTHINAIDHRPLGAADGRWRVLLAGGRAAYHAGYSPWFIAARAARRALSAPVGLSGILLLSGYVGARLRGEPRTAERDLVKFVREQQLRRLMLKQSLWK